MKSNGDKTKAASSVAKKHKGDEAKDKLSEKEYRKELGRLHVELVKLQEWVVNKGVKVCILFEGRDGAGKAGINKAHAAV